MRDLRFRLLFAVCLASAPAWADDADDLLKDLQAMQRPTGPASEATLRGLIDDLLPKVARAMGVTAPRKVAFKLVSRKEGTAKLLAVLARDYPGDTLARLGVALSTVGLCEPGVDLKKEAVALYGEHVSGFYDPHDHLLYLLDDQTLDNQTLIVAHELAHALQDDQLHLEALSVGLRGSEDAQLAFSAAIEGQAQAVAAEVLAAAVESSGDSDPGLAEMISELTAGSAEVAGTDSGNPWLGLQLRFPYSAGGKLVAALRTPADHVGKALIRRLPRSTAQVLQPDLYRKDVRPKAGAFRLAGLLQATPVYATSLGVANVDLFGQLHHASGLGDGWQGDQVEVVRKDGRSFGVWAIRFGSPAQAERMTAAWAGSVGGKVGGAPARQPDGSEYRVERVGSTALLFANIPDAQLEAVRSAAVAGFDG